MKRGQSLIEVLIATTLAAIFIGGAVIAIGAALKTSATNKGKNQVNVLANQLSEVLVSTSKGNWHGIYDVTKGNDYQITLSGSVWTISSGQETGTLNNIPYKRYFQVTNVNRDGSGNIVTSGGTDDPNTQKITIYVKYGNNYLSTYSTWLYLTRSFKDKIFPQTDWSGGSGQDGPIIAVNTLFSTSTNMTVSTVGQITLTSTSSQGTLESSILDSGINGGVGFNSLLWQGVLNSGVVKFQLACSNSSSGSWTYYGPTSVSDYYQPAGPSVSIEITRTGTAACQNMRYIRYKVFIPANSTSPRIDDIIINWNP